ncbi:MAG: hypothetical protein BME94_03595 [Methanobacteriales archaeon Met13]
MVIKSNCKAPPLKRMIHMLIIKTAKIFVKRSMVNVVKGIDPDKVYVNACPICLANNNIY